MILKSLSISTQKCYSGTLTLYTYEIIVTRPISLSFTHLSTIYLVPIQQGLCIINYSNSSVSDQFHSPFGESETTIGCICCEKIMIGICKQTQKPDVRLPITIDILRQLMTTLHLVFLDNYLATMIKAMFTVAFHAFLRVGEISISPTAKHTIEIGQVIPSPSMYIIYNIQCVSFPLSWCYIYMCVGVCVYIYINLSGIDFNTQEDEMVNHNFEKYLPKIKSALLQWSRGNITR